MQNNEIEILHHIIHKKQVQVNYHPNMKVKTTQLLENYMK